MVKKISDSTFAKKYTKNRYPIFTSDVTFIDDTPYESGASGYVVTEGYNPKKGETFDVLGKQVEKFFLKYRATHISNKMWLIPYKGKEKIVIDNLKKHYEYKRQKAKKIIKDIINFDT